MGLSRKLYEQVLKIFKPTEATFQPLVAQLPCYMQLTINHVLFAKIKPKLCEHYSKLKQAF